MSRPLRSLSVALALLYLGAHLASLPRSLEDIDTINFALGVESFDVTAHRPHPPGYPVFIAMGKLSTMVAHALAPAADRTSRAAMGLAIWGVAAGSVFVWILIALWRSAGWTPRAAWFAAALALVSPLFWFTSARPLTDAVALVAATAVQAVVWRYGLTASSRIAWVPIAGAACAAGLLVGMRTQTLWLTSPLLAWATIRVWRQYGVGRAAILVGAAAVGCLAWAVPLVVETGGLTRYLAALAAQGGEDFAGVEMLATEASARAVGAAVESTFIRPWRVEWLGSLVSTLAIVGALRLIWRDRRTAALLLAAFGPYLAFHLAFQETETVRYALPIVIPAAGLAVYAIFAMPGRVAVWGASLVTLASIITAHPSLVAYGRDVPPTFLAFADAGRAAREAAVTPLVVGHDGMRRVEDWFRVEWPELPPLDPGQPPWLRIVEHFRAGASAPVWFLTDRRRTDIVLFDRRARHVIREYVQEPEIRRLVGQARQDEVRWWEIAAPRWMLGRGWALSPEVAGTTFATGRDPRIVPAEAYLRRTDAAFRVLVGGWYLAGTEAGAVVVTIDGREVARWVVTPEAPSFVQWIDLPAGALVGEGAYATLHVRVEGIGDRDAPQIALQQFDAAAVDDVMVAFGEGWHQPESDEETGRSWRWAGPRATLIVQHGDGPVRLTVEGESSQRYFERPSNMVVSVEGREAARVETGRDFVETIALPAVAFTAAPARVVVALDQAFRPVDRDEGPDYRQLGLRFFGVDAGREDGGPAGPRSLSGDRHD